MNKVLMKNSTFRMGRSALRASLMGAIAVATLGAATLPNPSADESRAEKKTETVVLAGGCFWGIQGVFRRRERRVQRRLRVCGREQG